MNAVLLSFILIKESVSTMSTVNNDNDKEILISDRSCDTENWSNDGENSALHHRNKLQLKIPSNREFF